MLSLERFTAIRETSTRHQCAVVEAGVLSAGLGRTAAAAGMFYRPDPGSFEICTIGGNLATNAGGMRCVTYGVTRDSAPSALKSSVPAAPCCAPAAAPARDVAGYDLTSLFTGSEGTLGVITPATLRIRPRPPRPGEVRRVVSRAGRDLLGGLRWRGQGSWRAAGSLRRIPAAPIQH